MDIPKKHLQFIEEYAVDTRLTKTQFAEKFGVSNQTVTFWLSKYEKEIEEKINENLKETKEIIKKSSNKAVEALINLLECENPNAILGAARCLLETAGVKIERIEHSGNTGVNIQLVKPDNEE